MIEDDAYPKAIPLSREDAVELVSHPAEYPSVAGAFLSFVMVPLEERIGEWRYAGSSDSLSEALHRIGAFAVEMGLSKTSPAETLLGWLRTEALEVWDDATQAWSFEDLPLSEIGPHRVVLLGEGQPPHDDLGFCVFEIESLEDSPFKGRVPETDRPDAATADEE